MLGIAKILLLLPLFVVCWEAAALQTSAIERIAGGSEAEIQDYPYTVALHYDGEFQCGGAIISAKWFVTAARCIGEDLKERFTAYVGSTHKYTNGSDHPVSRIIMHPSYMMYGPYQTYPVFDISVIRVKKSFVFSDKIQPVKLPSANQVFPVGSMGTITGWGDVNGTLTEVYVDRLYAVSVPLMSKESCECFYGNKTITRTMLCAGFPEGGKTACDGDIGGPLVVDNVLVGLLSWGAGCGGKYPDVFTNIAYLRDWILTRTGV